MDRPARRRLLFDGECGICSWLALRARRIDRCARFEVVPYQLVPERDLAAWGLDHRSCARRLQLLSGAPPRPRRRAGAFAVNAFLWNRFPWNVGVALLYLCPPLLLLEVLGYELVAANRAWISRRLGLGACRPESMTGPGRVE